MIFGHMVPYRLPLPCSREGLTDCKLYCFGGEPKCLYISQGFEDRYTVRICFLGLEWTFILFRRETYVPFGELPERPASFYRMPGSLRTLSKGDPVRPRRIIRRWRRAALLRDDAPSLLALRALHLKEWDLHIGNMLSIDDAYDLLGRRDDR